MPKKIFDYKEVIKASTKYFNDDSLAAEVFAGKYVLRDLEGNIYEKTPRDMHRRLAKEFARIESKYVNPLSENKIFNLFKDWTVIPQGSPMSAIGNKFQIQSYSNCFVIKAPEDSYGGILRADQEEAQIMKRRGGVGFDISTIRPSGQTTFNAARTTDGIGVFMERFSNTCREVAQGGRRGALMLTISVHHPDIRKFINIKKDRKKVTGANISIRLSDEFMEAVEKGEEFQLRFPVEKDVEHKVEEMIDARELWEEIIESAHESAEPGLLFWDTVTKMCPADSYTDFGYGSISTNPCITGDTLIAVADGRNAVSIKQLAEEGKDVPVYSTNLSTGNIEIKIGRNPRLTKTDAEIWKLTLDDGSILRATPDHKILTNDLRYVELKDLKVNDSLYPFYMYNKPQKITSVAQESKEDVYNITVDDNYNYFVITPSGDDKHKNYTSGICVKNCGEITLSANDSCRLLLINLTKFVDNPFTKDASFNFKRFEKVASQAQRLMDDLVDLELEAIDGIINKIKKDPESDEVKRIELNLWEKIKDAAINGRRTGLGITGLGDALAMINICYGTDESVEKTHDIYRSLALGSYRSSVQMAKERGTFPIYSYEVEKDNEFIKRIMGEDKKLAREYKKYGRRNIANTTTAPAGSVSILAQTTSGCEPAFLLSYKRRKKINPNDEYSRVDFVDELGDKWQMYDVFHHGFKQWMEANGYELPTDDKGVKELIKKSPYHKSTSNDTHWSKKIEMQAAAQKWICHSISNTTNIPKDTSVDVVKDIYVKGWKLGCKGVTIYRDGCRDGVLVGLEGKDFQPDKIFENHAPKRPEELPCDIHRATVSGQQYIVLVGLFNNHPYEIFCGLSDQIDVPKKKRVGTLVKNGRKDGVATYNLKLPIGDDEMVFKNIVNMFDNQTYGAFSRSLSLALRHGVPVQYIVEQLRKDKYSDVTSFATVIARILSKHYIPDGTSASTFEKTCSNCGGKALRYEQGCVTCYDCGGSKCA